MPLRNRTARCRLRVQARSPTRNTSSDVLVSRSQSWCLQVNGPQRAPRNQRGNLMHHISQVICAMPNNHRLRGQGPQSSSPATCASCSMARLLHGRIMRTTLMMRRLHDFRKQRRRGHFQSSLSAPRNCFDKICQRNNKGILTTIIALLINSPTIFLQLHYLSKLVVAQRLRSSAQIHPKKGRPRHC